MMISQPKRPLLRRWCLLTTRLLPLVVCALPIGALMATDSPAPPTQLSDSTIQLRLETFARLDASLYQRSPKVKRLVDETAAVLANDSRLLVLIKHFGLNDQSEALLALARSHAKDSDGDEAIRLLLELNPEAVQGLAGADSSTLLRLLARNGSGAALDVVIPALLSGKTDDQNQARIVEAICRKKTGAQRLLQGLDESKDPLKKKISEVAIRVLEQTPWKELLTRFRAFGPETPATKNPSLADIQQLLQKEGNADEGRKIFQSATGSCINCHVAEGVGRDLGPNLSEIGKKLGKDALYDAILNPTAGISFDYEGWNLTLNSGDEYTGIIVSRTENSISLKNLLGQVIEVTPSEVFELQKMTTSLMPSGLGQLLGEKPLVDLVAYLSSLGTSSTEPQP